MISFTMDITLVRKPMYCPVCGGQMIVHGHKLKIINHPAIWDHKGNILFFFKVYHKLKAGENKRSFDLFSLYVAIHHFSQPYHTSTCVLWNGL